MKINKVINFLIGIIIILLIIQIINLYNAKKTYDSINRIILIPENLTYDTITFQEAINNQDYIIIDVREPEEHQSFHLKNSLNIPHGELLRNPEVIQYLNENYPNKTFVLYCYSNRFTEQGDGRSGNAASYLNELNISVKAIMGGINHFAEQTRLIIYNKSATYNIQDIAIKRAKSKCIVEFTYIKTGIKTENDKYYVDYPAAYLTKKEWEKILTIANDSKCHATCIDAATCFYAQIFGARLNKQNGEFEGYILK
ncbi:MAG: rhodanese-like domain-containing protein [Candidatus Woesearchaeota archaeon]